MVHLYSSGGDMMCMEQREAGVYHPHKRGLGPHSETIF